MPFEIYKDRKAEYRWRAVAHNGKIIADSAEGYRTHYNATRAAFRFQTLILGDASFCKVIGWREAKHG